MENQEINHPEKEFSCHYFIRHSIENDNGKHPFACVCLKGFKNEDGKWSFARGVSICSPKDDFKKKLGFMKASGVLSDGNEKTSVIRSSKLALALNEISWASGGLSLIVPNHAPCYSPDNRIVNNRYYKARFGLTLEDLTKKEKEIIDGYLVASDAV